MKKLRAHITYANVTSTLALLIALGAGTAYAADQLAPKSVGALQLRPRAVTAEKIRKHAVTAPKIEELAVKVGKISNGAVTTPKLGNGAVTSAKLASQSVTPEKIPNDSITGTKVEESTLSKVPSAAKADLATVAETSNPEAFAKVNSEGTVFPADSKGIGVADVKQGLTPGIYCIRVPGFTPRGGQVTPEATANAKVAVFIKFGGTASCPAPQVEVSTYNDGSPLKHPFYIVLYR